MLDQEPQIAAEIDKVQRGLLKEVCSFLKPFKDMRIILSSDQKPTIHAVLLVFNNLHTHIDSFTTKNLTMILIKSRMKKYLNEKFHIKPLHYIATFLFPKYRSTNAPTTSIQKSGIEKLRYLMEEVKESDNEESPLTFHDTSESFAEDLFDRFAEKPKENPSDEIEEYRNMTLSSQYLSPEACPFKFWSDHEQSLPKQSNIAMWLLSAPSTSCASERNFSTAGYIMDHRNRLLASSLDNTLFIRSNKDIL